MLLLAAALVASGCLSGTEDPNPQTGSSDLPGYEAHTRILNDAAQESQREADGLPAPDLEVGTAWTYEASGRWDLTDRFTVVVAEASEEGYLFAGAEPSDLKGEVHLERAWFGHRDAELNRLPSPQHPEGWPILDFPLYDGKTWNRGVHKVTAHAAPVETPSGFEPGYRMSLGDDSFNVTWTYAPSVGFLTSYTYTWEGAPRFDIRLAEQPTLTEALWYETGPVAETDDEGEVHAATLDVPDGFDHVMAYAGGTDGAAGTVLPAPGGQAPWLFSVDRTGEAFFAELFEATPGPWTLTASHRDGGFAFVWAVAVDWQKIPLYGG